MHDKARNLGIAAFYGTLGVIAAIVAQKVVVAIVAKVKGN
jgi:hypothetical protein